MMLTRCRMIVRLCALCRRQNSPVKRWEWIEAAFRAAGRTSLADLLWAICINDAISYQQRRCEYADIVLGKIDRHLRIILFGRHQDSDQPSVALWSRHNHPAHSDEQPRPDGFDDHSPQTHSSRQIAADLQPTIRDQEESFHSFVEETIRKQTDSTFVHRVLESPTAPSFHDVDSYKCRFQANCLEAHERNKCPVFNCNSKKLREERNLVASTLLSDPETNLALQRRLRSTCRAVGAMIWIDIGGEIFLLHTIKFKLEKNNELTQCYFRCGGRVEKDNEDPARRVAIEILEEIFCVVHSSQLRPNQRVVTDDEHEEMVRTVMSCLGKDAAYLSNFDTVDGKPTIYFTVDYLELVRALGLQAKLTAASRMPFNDKFQSLDNERIQCLAWVPLTILMGGGEVPRKSLHASLVNVKELFSRASKVIPGDHDLKALLCPGKDYDAIHRLCSAAGRSMKDFLVGEYADVNWTLRLSATPLNSHVNRSLQLNAAALADTSHTAVRPYNRPICNHFSRPSGCSYGAACRFSHAVSAAPLRQVGTARGGSDETHVRGSSIGAGDAPARRDRCRHFFSERGNRCLRGDECAFSHTDLPGADVRTGRTASHPLAKQSRIGTGVNGSVHGAAICHFFTQGGGCKNGERCRFSHPPV